MFCTTAWPDDGPARPETCRSSVKLIKLITLTYVHFVGLICNTTHKVKNVKLLQLLLLLMACRGTGRITRIQKYSVHYPVEARIY